MRALHVAVEFFHFVNVKPVVLPGAYESRGCCSVSQKGEFISNFRLTQVKMSCCVRAELSKEELLGRHAK